ncbi:Y-f family protein [Megaselia abdita]
MSNFFLQRWRAGVISGLNYIDLAQSEMSENKMSPKLNPYPSWEANLLSNKLSKSSIISPFRMQVDECDRLWVLDTGFDDFLGAFKQVTPNAIVVFDLKTDKLIARYEIPKSQLKEDSFMPNLIVDTSKKSCNKAFAYVADSIGFAIIVFSLHEKKSWRVKHNFFHIDPMMGTFSVADVMFSWRDGIFGMALGHVNPDSSRNMYFHSMISNEEFVVSNKVLQNETYCNDPSSYDEYKLIGNRGLDSHSTSEVFDEATSVLFYTLISHNGIGCWNTMKPLNYDNAILMDADDVAMVFPNDIKIDADRNLWVLTDRLPQYIYGKLNAKDVNYRILVGRIDDLIKDTPCDKNFM